MSLRPFLIHAGFSIYDLAATVGTPPSNLYMILNGSRPCRVDLAKRIEAATGSLVKAAWLTGLESPPPSTTEDKEQK